MVIGVIPLVLAAMVAWITFAGLRRKARKAGVMVCRRCRYPIAGLPSERCPECGNSFAERRPAHAGFAIRVRVAAKAGAWVLVFPYVFLAISTVAMQFAPYDIQSLDRHFLEQPRSGAYEQAVIECETVAVGTLQQVANDITSVNVTITFSGSPSVTLTCDGEVVSLRTSDDRMRHHRGELNAALLGDWLEDVYARTDEQLRKEAAEMVAIAAALADATQPVPAIVNFAGGGSSRTGFAKPRSSGWNFVILIVSLGFWVAGAAYIIRRGSRQHSAFINELQMRPA